MDKSTDTILNIQLNFLQVWVITWDREISRVFSYIRLITKVTKVTREIRQLLEHTGRSRGGMGDTLKSINFGR